MQISNSSKVSPSAHGPLVNSAPQGQKSILDGEDLGALLVLAQAYFEQNKWEKAFKTCQQILQRQPNAIAYHIGGSILRINGNLSDAAKWYNEALKLEPNFAEVWSNLGKIYADLGKWQEAINCYQKAVNLKPDFAEAYRNFSQVLTQVGQPTEAAECLYRALVLEPRKGTYQDYINLGREWIKLGNIERALTCYKEALIFNPNLPEIYHELGDLYQKMGQLTEAVNNYYQAISLNPQHSWSYNNLGDALIKLERWEEAIKSYQQAIQLKSDFFWSWNNLADTLLKVEKWEEAVKAYREAIKLNPAHSWSYNNLGDALKHLEKWEEATTAYGEAIKLNPDFFWSYYNLGEVWSKLGEKEQAINCYQKAITLDNNHFLSYKNLGDLCRELEKWEDAVNAYNSAIIINPNVAWLAYCLGDVLAKLARWDEAIIAYRQAKNLDENLPWLGQKLGEALKERATENLGEALGYYKKAIALDPDDILNYHRALSIKSDDANLYLELGNALVRKKCNDGAIVFYQMGLQVDGENAEIKEKLERILELKKIETSLWLSPPEIISDIVETKQVVNDQNLVYLEWRKNHFPAPIDFAQMTVAVELFNYRPLISIIMPVYNTPEVFLREAIESVINQIYPNWELCIADDASPLPHVKAILTEYSEKDSRIKVVYRSYNGHISRCSNSALEIATGEFISLLDHDDRITPDALYEVIELLNQHPDADMIYSDEDKLNPDDRLINPYFKPDWCPDLFLSQMYVCHFGTYRRQIVEEIGGFRVGYEGSQDYDLVLRFTEKTESAKIYHIPQVLYNWRIHPGSAAGGSAAKPYAYEASVKAIQEAIERRGEPGTVSTVPQYFGHHIIRYEITSYKLVSIIIVTQNLGELLDRCLESIVAKSTYPNYELIIINNGDQNDKISNIVAKWNNNVARKIKFYHLDIPFNYATVNNYAVQHSEGEYLLFLDDSIQVITPDWIEAMVEQSQRKSIGAVGVKLLDRDRNIQHAGIILGLCGVANSPYQEFAHNYPGYCSQNISINNYSAVSGACLMCRRDVFAEIGGFDEGFALAYNDVDLCLKMREEGYYNVYLPHVEMYYYQFPKVNPQAEEKTEISEQETELLKTRWSKYIENDHCYSIHLTRDNFNYEINPNSPKKVYAKPAQNVGGPEHQAAEALQQAGKLDEAIVAYEKAIEVNPMYFGSYHNLADILQQKNQLELAAENYRKAIIINPNFAWSHHNLGDALFKLDKLEESVNSYRQAIAVDPNFAWSHYNLGRALAKLNQYNDALQHYMIANQINPGLFTLDFQNLRDALVLGQDPSYSRWRAKNEPREADFIRMAEIIPVLRYQPLISIVMPVYNTPAIFLKDAIESVINQIYPNWELCIADDASPQPHIREILSEYTAKDQRIKVVYRSKNGHISACSNSALEIATGEFISLLDHDDTLTKDALYQVVLFLNQHPDADMIYSDEDKLTPNNEVINPYFKPEWSPESFLSRMYSCHLGTYRHSLIKEIGGFRVGFEGAQDWDLVLRFTEKTHKIYHIPKVLYHWRMHVGSAAGGVEAKPYAYIAGKKALQEAIERRGEPGEIMDVPDFLGHFLVRYQITDYKLVSIIIPTRDLAEVLDRCLESIFSKTIYPNYEVVLIDNGSQEPETFELINKWQTQEPDRFICHRLNIPFNFSKINNYGVKQAKGDYLLFLNNDTEVINPDWLNGMVEQVQRKKIGAAGALLLFPDETIQHAGVVLGLGGVAGHAYYAMSSDIPGYFGNVVGLNNVSAVTAACLMCRREVFEEIGGFNEELVVAYNDVELCLKMLKQGYRNVYLPHVKLYHYESKSRGYEDTPEKKARLAQESEILRSRWHDYIENDPYYSPHLTRVCQDYGMKG